MMTYQEYQAYHEDQRQALIKKYEDEGYFRPWAIARADYEIKSKHEAQIKTLTPLAQISPLD